MLPPFLTLPGGPLFRLQGMDRSMIGDARLYLASHDPVGGPAPLVLGAGDWLGGGTFRNSFYAETWRRLSRVQDLWLALDVQGSIRVQVMMAAPGRPAERLMQFEVEAPTRGRMAQAVALPGDLPEGARLFWHLEAHAESLLHEVAWCTRTPPAPVRLAVLLRTYGRAADLRAQLQRFADALASDPHHAEVLQRCDFRVLDASARPEADWQHTAALGLQLEVLAGPNLGGGGNASHLLALFLAQQATLPPEQQAGELLIMDDDLSLSMESLARYFAVCAWRRSDFITSLPVLMKSRPTTVWEDGGFWGRSGFGPGLGSATLRGLSPHLLRHGLQLDDYEPLDSFGPLNRCEYATFIFFGLPVAALRRLGLPAAFFLRGDDIELSLRALAQRLPLISNPNLAAWHEPGHGHGQEYMAILHGLLINFAHSHTPANHAVDFFQRRFAEHASWDDLAGMALYQRVLDDLLDPQSRLLAPDFEQHYLQTLPALAQAMSPLTPQDLAALRDEAAAGRVRLAAHLYPGMAPPPPLERQPLQTLLLDEAGLQVRVLEPVSPAQRLQAWQACLASLQQFEQRHEALRQQWQARLADSGTLAFWQGVAARHAGSTRRLACHAFAAPDQPTAPPLPRRVPRPLQHAAGAEPALRHVAAPRRPWLQRVLGAWQRPAAAAEAAPAPRLGEPLPADFDPAQYLALNADVARTGVDPGQHYLRYGRSEGRRYRQP